MPHDVPEFTPTLSDGVNHYSLRNPIRQISRIHSRHSLKYKLIETLNNTSETITEMAISQSQKKNVACIENDMIATYKDCCDIPNCYICSDTWVNSKWNLSVLLWNNLKSVSFIVEYHWLAIFSKNEFYNKSSIIL